MYRLIWLFFALMALGYITAPSGTASKSSKVPCCPGYGTTRCVTFQRTYEEAVQEYDRNHSGIPSGLVLPNGMTVKEFIESGRRPYGK